MSGDPRFIMVGGFLGAGKTTTIARLARHYQEQGKRVAIVTNDQATDLVDTLLLRAQGYQVGEVAGSCFCCNFDELTRTVERLGVDQLPEVVLAEPVGSCTDLVATVLRPLQQVYQRPLEIAPFGVIIKPTHGRKILQNPEGGGFSPQAEYIFRKQLEESDFILINRIDELSQEHADALRVLIEQHFPGRPILPLSARTGLGFPRLMELLSKPRTQRADTMELDYDLYAEGESHLGWLNCQLEAHFPKPLEVDFWLVGLLDAIARQCRQQDAPIAHLKAIAMGEGIHSVANVIDKDHPPQLSLACQRSTDVVSLVINARVAIAPEALTQIVQTALQNAAPPGTTIDRQQWQSFRPGRPVPTHRITSNN
ncbi:MAG: GTP-binding protein [Pirellulaceae bacterium]|jgi:G3E family GTPase